MLSQAGDPHPQRQRHLTLCEWSAPSSASLIIGENLAYARVRRAEGAGRPVPGHVRVSRGVPRPPGRLPSLLTVFLSSAVSCLAWPLPIHVACRQASMAMSSIMLATSASLAYEVD